MLQNNVGILAMLDEECLRPGDVSDVTFLEKLNQVCSGHAHYESRGCRKTQSDRTLPHDAFRLVHYAGSVTVCLYICVSLYFLDPFFLRVLITACLYLSAFFRYGMYFRILGSVG